MSGALQSTSALQFAWQSSCALTSTLHDGAMTLTVTAPEPAVVSAVLSCALASLHAVLMSSLDALVPALNFVGSAVAEPKSLAMLAQASATEPVTSASRA